MDTILNKYYNNETKTLTLPWIFDEKLNNLPLGVQIMIFEEDWVKNNIQNLINQSIHYQIQ
jgi:hypothetical protein